MAEIEATISSKETTKEKAAAAFGMNQPSALDVVRRDDYVNDVEYIHALAETQARMDDPAYQRAARKVAAEDQQRHEKEIRDEQRKEYAAILTGVKLSDMDRRSIDTQAAELARKDLAAGKIFASDLGKQIEKHAGELTEKKKRELAAGIQFNRALRGL